MGECDLKVLAANGEVIPYDGWIEVIVNVPGNDSPNHSIKDPFLVICNELLHPLLGFNVIQEIILSQGDETEALPAICNLLRGAMQIETNEVEAVVNFIRAGRETDWCEQVPVKVGSRDIVVQPGQMAHPKFPVPTSFNHSLALFEVSADNLQLEQIDIGDGLVEIHHTERLNVEIPVANLTKQNIVLVSRTTLGSIQAIDRIIPTDQENSVQVSGIDTQPHKKPELWHPPIDISHLRKDEQAVVKELLYEESNAFAHDDHDIGCIPGL